MFEASGNWNVFADRLVVLLVIALLTSIPSIFLFMAESQPLIEI
jgi:hypothetical protein